MLLSLGPRGRDEDPAGASRPPPCPRSQDPAKSGGNDRRKRGGVPPEAGCSGSRKQSSRQTARETILNAVFPFPNLLPTNGPSQLAHKAKSSMASNKSDAHFFAVVTRQVKPAVALLRLPNGLGNPSMSPSPLDVSSRGGWKLDKTLIKKIQTVLYARGLNRPLKVFEWSNKQGLRANLHTPNGHTTPIGYRPI